MSTFKLIWKKWCLSIMCTLPVLYVLLCTYVWNIVYSFVLAVVTNNAPVYEVAKNPWCEPGDWVIQTFQPMVSDQRMIDHYVKNKDAMNRVAEIVSRKKDVDAKGWPLPEFTAMVNSIGIDSFSINGDWADEPYSMEKSVESYSCWKQSKSYQDRSVCIAKDKAIGRGISIVSARPIFGKTVAQYFCTTARNSTKGYVYFPGGLPQIQDTHVLSMPTYSDRYKKFESNFYAELVESTDVQPREDIRVLKRIDSHWFIYR